MHAPRSSVLAALAPLLASPALGAPADSLPIREITTFKDGHALVLRSGEIATQENGDAVLTELPNPIMGAFWVDESEPGAMLASVTAARIDYETTRTVASNPDLLRANIGRRIRFSAGYKEQREGEILDVIEPGGIVVIDMQGEVAALPIDQIRNIGFIDTPPAQSIAAQGVRETLTLDLAWSDRARESAAISMMYIERGFRWIPSYRITVLDDDRVEIELRATLVNELADIDNATVHLAVGVPTFAFAGTPDPMSLRDHLGDLGMLFRDSQGGGTAQMLSNSLRSQMTYEYASSPFQGADDESALPPELAGSDRTEDLFVFTMQHVTLARGSRMSVPLISYTAPATSLYKLNLAGGPPVQALESFNRSQQQQLARLESAPIARHVLRIRNENEHAYPITTAPATVFKDGQVLAQGLIRYAAPGGTVDLEVGSAVDIAVKDDEVESAREPKGLHWQNRDYARVDIAYSATLTNRKPHTVTVEIEKIGFGQPGDAGPDAQADAINVFSLPGAEGSWWRWYGWPYYWHRLNGASRFRWTVEIPAGEAVDIHANWHYFWR